LGKKLSNNFRQRRIRYKRKKITAEYKNRATNKVALVGSRGKAFNIHGDVKSVHIGVMLVTI
jgi:hypothetical protein